MTIVPVPMWAFVLLILLGIPSAFFILMIPFALLMIFITDKMEDHYLKKYNKKIKEMEK